MSWDNWLPVRKASFEVTLLFAHRNNQNSV
nr:MAG TPA: hypothetical protein [Caudoviricetes sp.]